jgi:hypothetical protein
MKKILFYFIIAGFLLSGCRDWLDINRDPNNAEIDIIPMEVLLPATQTRIADILNNSSNQGFLSHHLTKSGSVGGTFNYLTGRLQPQDGDGFWQQLYTVNTNLGLIKNKAVELGIKSYEGIAVTLMTHNFQRLVDMYGNIPYTEALGGKDLYQPVYDDAKTIYTNLLADIDHAIACFTAAQTADQVQLSTTNRIATYDVMAKGDMAKWIRFAHSLRLRILMRISDGGNYNAEITASVGKGLAYNELMECNPGYQAVAGKMKPWSTNFGWNQLNASVNGQSYYRPTRDLIDMLRDNNDPRLRVYAQPRLTIGEDDKGFADYTTAGLLNEYYIGIPFGQQNPPENMFTCSIGIGSLYLKPTRDPTTNSPILGGFETSFLLAEAALKGYIPGGDAEAQKQYENGVKGVFAYLNEPLRGAIETPGYPTSYAGMRPPITGTAEAAATTYLSQAGNTFCNWSEMTTNAQKLNAIASQKWISLFGVNPIEAWSEFRRLDLPELGSSTQSQELYNIAILPYPQTEINLNLDNYLPNGEGRDVYKTLVFWDKINPLAPRVKEYIN